MAKISKILYIVTQSELGGASRYIFDLARNLPSDKFEVIVAGGGVGELGEKINALGLNYYHLNNLVREIEPFRDLLAVYEICRLIIKTKPDIVHLNSSKAGVVGSIAAKICGVKKIIYTAHGFVFNEPLSTFKKNLYRWSEKITSNCKDKIICVSEFDRQSALKNKIAKSSKLMTINNGIEALDFADATESKKILGVPADSIVIGTVANLYRTKGLNFLISAIVKSKINHPGIYLRIVGDGELANELAKQINELNAQNYIKVGKISHAYRYLKAFDIFVMSSVKEGFPYALLEAMAAGLPIVATKVGGIPEMIETDKTGSLVDAKNVDAISTAVESLLTDKQKMLALGANAKREVEKEFRLDKMIAKTIAVYE